MTAFWASLIFVVLAEMGKKPSWPRLPWLSSINPRLRSGPAPTLACRWPMPSDSSSASSCTGILRKGLLNGAALVFIGFGIYSIHENVPERILTPVIEVFSLLTIIAAGWLLASSTQDAIEPEPEEG